MPAAAAVNLIVAIRVGGTSGPGGVRHGGGKLAALGGALRRGVELRLLASRVRHEAGSRRR